MTATHWLALGIGIALFVAADFQWRKTKREVAAIRRRHGLPQDSGRGARTQGPARVYDHALPPWDDVLVEIRGLPETREPR